MGYAYMYRLMAAGVAAATLSVSPAAAVPKTPTPTIVYTPGIYTVPSWTTAKVFQDFQSVTSTQAYKPKAGETVTGTGVYAVRDSGNTFLEVLEGSSYKVSFAQPMQVFSFSLGLLSSANSLTLSFANGTSLALSGLQIVGSTKASLLGTSGQVTFDMGGQSGILSALFKTTSDCDPFYIDNMSSAAPEPGTWGMMILGFGLAGAALRRRRTTMRVRFA